MYIDRNGSKWYKVGLHIHTTLSDGRLSPEEMAEVYKNAGFDAVAITDHWKYYPEGEINGLKIISGCEYNIGSHNTIDGVMHIVGIGMKENPNLERATTERQQAIDAINASGGMAVLAHPAWSLNTKEDVKALNGFSLLEIYNAVSEVEQSNRPYSGYIVDVLANDGIEFPLIATDDVHYYNGEDDAKAYIMVNSESGEINDILAAIKERRFYATQGPELYVRAEDNRITVDCTDCKMISIVTNSSWEGDRISRGEKLIHAEYELKDYEKWVRVEVIDENGNYAWSSVIMKEN